MAKQHNMLVPLTFYLLICKYQIQCLVIKCNFELKKSRSCKQVWTKQYYLAVKHLNKKAVL